MAFITSEQADVMRQLKTDHGPTDREMLEHTSEPYGLVWMRWHTGGDGDPTKPGVWVPDRNLFIKPDGTRLSWSLIGGI